MVTKNDCQAVLALLNEYCHDTATMKIKQINGGAASINHNRFTVPMWALIRGETYAFYYVIHEFTHAHFSHWYHDKLFKAHERQLLSLFGISIDYAKAYPRRLYANGECQYTKKGKR